MYGSKQRRQGKVTKAESRWAIVRPRRKGPIVFWEELNSVALQLTALLLPRRSFMNLHLQFLRPSNALGTLQGDGWEIEPESETWILVKHVDVPDEIAARKRLDRLGLLTSRSIRIDFQDSRRRIRAAF
jgi:hypothetical protein